MLVSFILYKGYGWILMFQYRPTEILEPHGQIPTAKPTIEEAEQATAFAHACSVQTTPPPLKPVSMADLQHTLRVKIRKCTFVRFMF